MNYSDLDVDGIVGEVDRAFEQGLMKPVPSDKMMEIRQAAQETDDLIAAHIHAKRKVTVSLRLPVGIVNEVKSRAANAGIPWSSYVSAILERAVAK